MSVHDMINNVLGMESPEEKLYKVLTSDNIKETLKNFDEIEDLGEGMAVVRMYFSLWSKPRFLINHNTKRAYEFMDAKEHLVTVTEDDIDWESLKALPQRAQNVASNLSFHYPSFILRFQNGVAQVSWQLTPDGRYYMDEDGYGMTDDKEVEIYGFIDTEGHVLVKFRNIRAYSELGPMREQAEKMVRTNSNNNKM